MTCEVVLMSAFLLMFTSFSDSKSIGGGAAYINAHNTTNGQTHHTKAGYYTADEENYTVGLVAKVGFGAYKVSGKHPNGNESYNLEVLTTGLEVGSGMMGRAGIVDATVKKGPVGINLGIAADTGLMVKDGLEVKVLGIGGAITKNGIQACFFVCIGISWGVDKTVRTA